MDKVKVLKSVTLVKVKNISPLFLLSPLASPHPAQMLLVMIVHFSKLHLILRGSKRVLHSESSSLDDASALLPPGPGQAVGGGRAGSRT